MAYFNDYRDHYWQQFTIVRENAVGAPLTLARAARELPPKNAARIGPLDVLSIHASGVDQRFSNGYYLVEPGGQIPLGTAFGRVDVAGMTMEQLEQKLARRLTTSIYFTAYVQVTTEIRRASTWLKAEYPTPHYTIRPGDVLLVRAAGTMPQEPIDGLFAVEPGGTVPLLPMYSRAQVSGLTLETAETAIKQQLELTLARPDVAVTLPCWNGFEPLKLRGVPVFQNASGPIRPGEWLIIWVVGRAPISRLTAFSWSSRKGRLRWGRATVVPR